MKKLMERSLKILAAVGMVFGAAAAQAGTASGTLGLEASVEAQCEVNSPTLSFGVYDMLGGVQKDASADLVVRCTNGSAYTIFLGEGSHFSSGRRLQNGSDATNFLSYELYSDSNRTSVWGATAETDVADVGSGNDQTHTIYGRIAADQRSAKVGAYADSVAVTVNY